MPYDVKSRCETCGAADDFVIGLWPEHLGILACGASRKMVNVPLEGGACPGGGRQPAADEFYDYPGSIPYLGGASLGPLEPGPECPRCRRGRLSFETTSQINVGHLGQREDGRRPWLGKEYLEKAIFVYALMAVCSEFELRSDEILRHSRLDIPKGLMAGRRVSLPILMDIRSHLVAMVATGETDFALTPKLRSVMAEEFGDLMAFLKTMPR
jgi:hypothetical protein